MGNKKSKKISNNKSKGMNIDELSGAKVQNQLIKFLKKNKKTVITVLCLFMLYVVTTIITWYMFFKLILTV